MNHYPICVSGDTGALSDIPSKALDFAKAYPVVPGAAVGALLGHMAGKHTLIGALIGAAGGFIVKKYQTAP